MNPSVDITLPRLQAACERSQAEAQGALERLRCELRFAAHLCALHAERADAWRPLLAEAVRQAEAMLAGEQPLAEIVSQVETVLAPMAETAKSYHVHALGHAHIDMNWTWSWPETVAVVNDTFSTVLRLMEEFPEFHFTQSQAAIYRIVERHNPEMFARIAERVREGRWEVAASHWVEGDKNLAGAESLCRHLLYTRRYLQDRFALTPEDVQVDWSPDTFGHAATVPTYLVQGGVKYCFLHRPGAHAEKWPQAFRWLGPDNASIIVFNGMRGGYNGVFCPRMMLDRIESWYSETGLRVAPYLYGVGDHGGGPTRRDLLRFHEIRHWPIFPTLRLAPAATFFAELESHAAGLPEVRGELNYVFTGCYTSQSLLKKCNRLGENRLDDAERAATMAWTALAAEYPGERLESAWKKVLFSQFHDILPGSCVHDSRTYSHGLFQQSMADAGIIETLALRTLAAAVDTREPTISGDDRRPELPPFALRGGFAGGAGNGTSHGGLSLADGCGLEDERTFVAFNLEQESRSEVVEATIWENARDYANHPFHRQDFSVVAPDGAVRAGQILEKGTYWGHDFVRLAFPVEVPALGYARYTIRERAKLDAAPPTGAWQVGREDWPARYSFHDLAEEGLENACLRLEIEPRTGGIRRLTDKLAGRDLISPDQPAPVLEFGIERAHGMNSWAIDHAHSLQPWSCQGLKRVANGPYMASVDVAFALRESSFTLTYELRADDPRLYLRLNGTWREFGGQRVGVPFVRLALPLNLASPRLTREIAFGAITSDFHAGEEVPALQWVMVRDQGEGREAGVLLVNDGKHGHALAGQTLRVNLIRSSYDPDPEPEIGRHEMAFALQAVPGDLSVAAATRMGRAFNHPLRMVATNAHPGPLPATSDLIRVSPDEWVVQSVKKAEDDPALVVRLANPSGEAVEGILSASPALGRCIVSATDVDLMERNDPAGRTTSADATGAVRASIPAYGVRSLRLQLSNATSSPCSKK